MYTYGYIYLMFIAAVCLQFIYHKIIPTYYNKYIIDFMRDVADVNIIK